MARTVFQQLGKWFPRAGKVAVFSTITNREARGIDETTYIECYLFGFPNMVFGDGTCDELTTSDLYPIDAHATGKIMKISPENAVNVLSDIPEGYSFYLTDQEDGDEPSEELKELGCFITWSE